MDISIVIPLLNEEESLPELSDWIMRVANENALTYEVIFVDDGSTDASWAVICSIAAKDCNFKGIRFQRNYGKSAALNEGFKAAKGNVVITMDADMQDSPDEIPELFRMISEDGFDIVSGILGIRLDIVRDIFLRALLAGGESAERESNGERRSDLHGLSPMFLNSRAKAL